MMMKKRFILATILALIVIAGGVGIGLAWRTNRLDRWLPPRIVEMFGRGAKPEEQPGEKPEEKPGEQPEEKPEEEPTKDWKTWENESFGISFKYPETYQITQSEYFLEGIELILSDETRPGNPEITMLVNTGDVAGLVAQCMSDIRYAITIKEGRAEILSRSFYDRAKHSVCLNFGDIDKWVIFFHFIFEKSSGPVCPLPESKYCLFFQCGFSFLRDGPDYEPELRQIIETIRVTD